MARNRGAGPAAPRGGSGLIAGAVAAIVVVAALAAVLLGGQQASADGGCDADPHGIDCGFGGTTTSTSVGGGPGDPIRYLATTTDPGVGDCWYWSSTPPGLDSWDSGNDPAIIFLLRALPECPGRPGTQTFTTSRAWEVFRSFPLSAPRPRLQPAVGVTNLPTWLEAPPPPPLAHTEVLPDGTTLRVRARVRRAWVTWGDGTPPLGFDPGTLQAHPAGTATHAYRLKTCSAKYRAMHPSGGNCHPSLTTYPVRITWEWHARYRAGPDWIDLGTIDRTATIRYDVDEIVGVTMRN